MISLDRDGDVWILRMAAGENRFNLEWLDAVNTALDEVDGGRRPGRAGQHRARASSTPTAWTWTGWPATRTRPRS